VCQNPNERMVEAEYLDQQLDYLHWCSMEPQIEVTQHW
jgi:hypothetical protein